MDACTDLTNQKWWNAVKCVDQITLICKNVWIKDSVSLQNTELS